MDMEDVITSYLLDMKMLNGLYREEEYTPDEYFEEVQSKLRKLFVNIGRFKMDEEPSDHSPYVLKRIKENVEEANKNPDDMISLDDLVKEIRND